MAVPNGWLRALAQADAGPIREYHQRGTAFARTYTIAAALTGATLRGQIRAVPDSPAALATFHVSGAVIAGATTAFTLTLTRDEVNALPADTLGLGYVELPFDLKLTLPGEEEALLVGGVFKLLGTAS